MIGIIAGTGSLPAQACKKLIEQKELFFIIVLFPLDNKNEIEQICNSSIPIICLTSFKASELIKTLQSFSTTHLFMIGKFDKLLLLKKIKFDWLTLSFLSSLMYKSDARIMQGIVDKFEKEYGIVVLKQDDLLDGLKIAPGVVAGELTQQLQNDILLGIVTAKSLSENDIGQTVIVKNGMVLAVEAIEGTDACIRRGIDLGRTGIVICKAVHPNQNKKFDLPTLGPNTLKPYKSGQIATIAWLSEYTLIAHQEEFIKLAKQKNITLVSL